MATDDPPSPAEVAFLELLSRPAAYAVWAAGVRLEWELANVVWFHGYRNGKAVWRRNRPPRDPDPERSVRFASRASIGDDSR